MIKNLKISIIKDLIHYDGTDRLRALIRYLLVMENRLPTVSLSQNSMSLYMSLIFLDFKPKASRGLSVQKNGKKPTQVRNLA